MKATVSDEGVPDISELDPAPAREYQVGQKFYASKDAKNFLLDDLIGSAVPRIETGTCLTVQGFLNPTSGQILQRWGETALGKAGTPAPQIVLVRWDNHGQDEGVHEGVSAFWSTDLDFFPLERRVGNVDPKDIGLKRSLEVLLDSELTRDSDGSAHVDWMRNEIMTGILEKLGVDLKKLSADVDGGNVQNADQLREWMKAQLGGAIGE